MTSTAFMDAHWHCRRNRREIAVSEICGCYFCLGTYPPAAIVEWADPLEQTAVCPRCQIDAVIGPAAGYPISSEFLQHMRATWFGNE